MNRRYSINDVLRAPEIPTLPKVAVQVLALARDPNVCVEDLARVIQKDQALAVKVLRTVNSPLYGLVEKCSTIRRAVTFLGLDAVRMLALSFSLVASIDGGDEDDVSFEYRSYWRRAVYGAAAARHIAAQVKCCDPEEALLAALLQDLGMIAMYEALGDIYLQILDVAGENHRELRRCEQRTLKFNHAMVGARLLRSWDMPESLVTSTWFHETPDDADPEHLQITRVVNAATLLAIVMSVREPAGALAEYHDRVQLWFGLDAPRSQEVLHRTALDAHQLARLLDLDTGPRPDVNALLDEARVVRAELSARSDLAA